MYVYKLNRTIAGVCHSQLIFFTHPLILKIIDSFGILMPRRFHTVPDLWIWWRIDWVIQGWRQSSISKESVKTWREVKFWNALKCLRPWIFHPKLHQLNHVEGVSKSSWWADSETVIGSSIWPRFHGENIRNILLQTNWET